MAELVGQGPGRSKVKAGDKEIDHVILALLSFFFSGGIISVLSGHTPSLLDGLVPD